MDGRLSGLAVWADQKPGSAFGPPPGGPSFDPKWFQTMMEKAEREKAMRREQINRFEAREKITSNITMKYRLFVPKNAEAKSLPLLVCLHGIGECGNDNDAPMTANNMAWDWVEAQDKGLDEPCMILVPQSPLPIPNNIWELPYLQIVAEILDDICAQYPVDQDRLYLTGLSLGGFGAWNLNRLCPNRFAAVVTCCPACLKGSMFHNSIDEECLGRLCRCAFGNANLDVPCRGRWCRPIRDYPPHGPGAPEAWAQGENRFSRYHLPCGTEAGTRLLGKSLQGTGNASMAVLPKALSDPVFL